MKKLSFDYYMQIDYSEMVSRCNYTIKCIPVDNARQKISDLEIELYPESVYSFGKDGLNNQQITGCNDTPHTTFFCHVKGKALVGLADYEERENTDLSMIFRHPHGLNVAGEKIKAYYEKLTKEITLGNDPYLIAGRIMHRLHKDFQYCPNCTNIYTSAEEAFSQGKGVCQDFAHIFISLLHLSGVPARYVTGLQMGEGASHAWVEILKNGKWIGLDPTNDTWILNDHIKLGVGRDAADCMINRGIMHGGGLHTQTVQVKVSEIEEEL